MLRDRTRCRKPSCQRSPSLRRRYCSEPTAAQVLPGSQNLAAGRLEPSQSGWRAAVLGPACRKECRSVADWWTATDTGAMLVVLDCRRVGPPPLPSTTERTEERGSRQLYRVTLIIHHDAPLIVSQIGDDDIIRRVDRHRIN